VIALEAVDIPIFEDNKFVGLLGVEEDTIAPRGGTFRIIIFFLFDVLVGGEEIYGAFAIHTKRSRTVV
jgi:hypothetical protein